MDSEKLKIIIDTREHAEVICRYIIPYFNRNGIEFVFEKLDFGDYSFIYNGVDYRDKFVIERKMSLVELAGNLSKGRQRFEAEMLRAKEKGAKIILMVENGCWGGILDKTYNTKFGVKAYYATLLSWRLKYDLTIDFVYDKYAGLHILQNFIYFIRNEERKGK